LLALGLLLRVAVLPPGHIRAKHVRALPEMEVLVLVPLSIGNSKEKGIQDD